jgi:hypothetical protein
LGRLWNRAFLSRVVCDAAAHARRVAITPPPNTSVVRARLLVANGRLPSSVTARLISPAARISWQITRSRVACRRARPSLRATAMVLCRTVLCGGRAMKSASLPLLKRSAFITLFGVRRKCAVFHEPARPHCGVGGAIPFTGRLSSVACRCRQ